MTATSPVRSIVKSALVDALRNHSLLQGVDVFTGWPGESLGREAVWISRTSGQITYPFMMAGRKTRDDEFTVTVMFMAGSPGNTIEEADARVEVLWSALDDVFANDQTLSVDGAVWTLEGATVEGPTGEFTDEGAVSFIQAEIEVKARYE